MARKKIRQRPKVGVLGKALTRRSHGCCELCQSKNEPFPFELSPFPEEPAMERTLLACKRCREWLDGKTIQPREAHFLSRAVWADEPAVRLAAARLLLSVDDSEDPWMRDALDAVDVDPTSGELREPPSPA